ncbi:MAG: peptidase C25, partial [Thermoplasmatales archaeon]
FSEELKPLVDHKNSHGMRSKLVTLNKIYWGVYFPVKGRDKAEKLKYFIKHALEEWGIKYVLLVGGRKGGIFKPWWWVPVRYSNIVDFIENSHLSDLYFADIYDSEGNFSSWDTNHNNVFGEWSAEKKDILDMYPEVFVGRLPCKNRSEVKIMVDKIINYENTAYGEDWFKKFVGVAGDTFPHKDDPYYEGELATEASYRFLDGFEATYLWTSTGAFQDKQDVIMEINKGCGFMSFSGHGNPREWCTHPPNEENWTSAPNCFEMDELNNYEKLPIVIVNGCWNSKFSTGLLEILKGIITQGRGYFKDDVLPNGYYTYDWVPKCWSWSTVSQSEGGSIAIIGNTGLGHGIQGEECLSGRYNFMEIQFYKSYGEGRDVLGETHSNQIIYYMNEFPPMEDNIDCKIVQILALLGDPSLKIGGYPPNH